MITIHVTSFIFDKTNLTGSYELTDPKTIQDFVESLGLKWNSDSLVVVNGIIVEEYYELKDGDKIQLLIPILGG